MELFDEDNKVEISPFPKAIGESTPYLEYKEGEVIDVLMGEMGVISDNSKFKYLGTSGLATCVGVSFWYGNILTLAHLIAWNDIPYAINLMRSEFPSDAKVSGRVFNGDPHPSESLIIDIKQILKLSQELGINILSADVFDEQSFGFYISAQNFSVHKRKESHIRPLSSYTKNQEYIMDEHVRKIIDNG